MIITGIGSRRTPRDILELMRVIPNCYGYDTVIRSGGADGADTAFETGARNREIYLPWRGFNRNPSSLFLDNMDQRYVEVASQLLFDLHPKAAELKQGPFKLHTRNIFQVLGHDLQTPSDLLICWTPDGAYRHDMVTYRTGGTGTAIKLASLMDIPIYNLARKSHLKHIEKEIEMW